MSADVEAVYNFSTELLTTKQVSDETLRAAKSVLGGDKGVVDLVGTLGFLSVRRDADERRPAPAAAERQGGA